MDLGEWELLPDDGFLESHEDDDGKQIFSRRYTSDSNTIFRMNYFTISPTPNPSQFVDTTVPNQLQIQLEPTIHKSPNDHEVTKEVITEIPFEINMLPSTISEKIKAPQAILETEQDQVSQVFFKKMKETESRLTQDVKVESPKSSNKTFVPQFDATPFQFEEKNEVKEIVMKKMEMETEIHRDNNGVLKLWNWSLTGIGAICSFGVAAAATICIVFIGNRQKHKQNQQLRFQIFSDDKRIKEVVHHASKMNEAMSAVRGVPITRAHITVGGHYDAL